MDAPIPGVRARLEGCSHRQLDGLLELQTLVTKPTNVGYCIFCATPGLAMSSSPGKSGYDLANHLSCWGAGSEDMPCFELKPRNSPSSSRLIRVPKR